MLALILGLSRPRQRRQMRGLFLGALSDNPPREEIPRLTSPRHVPLQTKPSHDIADTIGETLALSPQCRDDVFVAEDSLIGSRAAASS